MIGLNVRAFAWAGASTVLAPVLLDAVGDIGRSAGSASRVCTHAPF